MTEPTLLDGLMLLLQDAQCNLGWRIAAKVLLPAAEFETLLQQIQEEQEVLRFADKLSPALKKQVRSLLTTLRKVRDRKDLPVSNASELFSQIGVDIYATATESLRDQLEGIERHLVDPAIRSIPIEVTTFQSSKGLAADYVFITHFDDRYCVRDKDAGMSDQDVCSFLVALTRARRGVYLLSTHSTATPTFLSWIDDKRIREIQSPGASSAQN